MAYLEESYVITSEDESSSVTFRKDVFGNLVITSEDESSSVALRKDVSGNLVITLKGKTLIISEEICPHFVYALNRLT